MKTNLSRLILGRHPRRLELNRLPRHFAGDILLWGVMAASVRFLGPWGGLLAAGLFSVFVFRAFGLMHECVHSSALRNRALNSLLGELYGVFSFLPFRSWRQLHLDHHSWTGNVNHDPSMKILANFAKRGFKVPKSVTLSWAYWIPFLGFMQHLVFWSAARSKKEYVFIAGSLVYLGAAFMLLGPMPLVLGSIFYLYLVEIINFPHHLGLAQHEGEERFPAGEQHRFARSCIYPRWIAHNVFLNFNLHTEHHLFPSHPWYQLDAIHEELLRAEGNFNFSNGNAWILKNRRKPVDELFKETFADREKNKAA